MEIINLFGARFQYPQDKQLSEWLTAESCCSDGPSVGGADASDTPATLRDVHFTPADLPAYSTNLTGPRCMAPPGWLSHRTRNRGCPSRFRGNNSSACCKRIPSD